MDIPVFLPDAFAEVGEPSLQPLPSGAYEAYRLIARGNYPPSLNIIRVECCDNPVVAAMAQGRPLQIRNEAQVSIEDVGVVLERFAYRFFWHDWPWLGERCSAERELYPTQWLTLRLLVEASHFWDLPERGGHVGVDGGTLTLEASLPGRYHRVCRWCPNVLDDQENFVLPCGYLRDLAKLLIPETD